MAVPQDPASALRQWQEQQLRSRLLVLQQQAASAVAAASKVQRETYIGNLTPGAINDMMLRQARGLKGIYYVYCITCVLLIV